jgi:hypothetical protein
VVEALAQRTEAARAVYKQTPVFRHSLHRRLNSVFLLELAILLRSVLAEQPEEMEVIRRLQDPEFLYEHWVELTEVPPVYLVLLQVVDVVAADALRQVYREVLTLLLTLEVVPVETLQNILLEGQVFGIMGPCMELRPLTLLQ